MYHCRIQFYLLGEEPGVFAPIKAISPLDGFTHDFMESGGPDSGLCARADVILADLRDREAVDTVRLLEAGKKAGAELIVLAGREQSALLAEGGFALTDIWPAPLSEAELVFRFRKWQRDYKLGKDCWEANHFLEAGIGGSPNIVWFKDKDGVHVKVNDSFCETVGKTKEQVEGKRHAYIWDVEEDDPAFTESERIVMETGKTCISEETVRIGGAEKQLTTYRAPLYDLDGSVMGTAGLAVDVTKERVYAQKLEEKNRTLEMIFSTLDCGVMCHSIDGRDVISINRAALELLGYESREKLVEDGFTMVAQSVLDEDKPRLRACITSLQQIGDSVSVEYRVRHKDGKLLHILGNVKLIEEDGQQLYQRFLLDFTAQKQREEEKWAQKDQEIQYQEKIFEIFSNFLADNVDDIYMMLDGSGKEIQFISSNVERVLGLSPEGTENLLGQLGKARYLTGKRVSREELEALQPGMSLEPRETERMHQKTGEHRWFRESIYCVSVQNVKKIIVYISDRTAERKSQNALREALDMAKVASRAKSAFLSSVSHDIRTPMNAIMGMATLLQEEADNPEQVAEYTRKISAASQHLLGLINDVLDMNKIESGSAVLNIGELNMAEIIEDLNTIIRPQAKAKEQDFEVFTTYLTHERLLGDKLRINQILFNILSNAVKYTPAGGRIEMWVAELPQVNPSYSRIRFTVTDNGQGMSKEFLKVIFDPFTRELNTGINEIQGTGLGMAITKSLVDLMNGTIKVTSKAGRGTTFVVELELRIQKEDEDPAFWEKYGIARILVVDDDEEICQDIVKKMTGSGVETEYATRGSQAVDMLQAAMGAGKPYDLLLLDWKMPGQSGLKTASLIQENYPNKIPSMLFTAYDWNDIEREAQEAGINHFLSKPFFMSNFKEAISRMMDHPASASEEETGILEGKRVLVVDDIEINRMILVKVLSRLGALYDEAKNGREAVQRFEASQPGEYDIIMMDIQMPVMDGYEATRAIRASVHPSAQSVAIIAMTANAFVEDVRGSLEAGMDAHIAKPIVLDQLKSTIREVLARKQGTQEQKT